MNWLENLFDEIIERKAQFLLVFFIVFSITYLFLMAIDFLPEAPTEEVVDDVTTSMAAEDTVETEATVATGDVADTSNTQPATAVVSGSELPELMYIPALDRTVPILNPTSRLIADLDEALLSGVVRHPDSATLAQEGNVFVLGHSSYLPNVFNKNFQAFNGIQNLEWGDEIEIYTKDQVFVYEVDKVYRAKAQDVTVPIANTGNMLTLATCNSFGSTDDRYIVEAKRKTVKARNT